jgi:hypothetical protein
MANKSCQCGACRERFNSLKSFELHRVAHQCRSVTDMQAMGFARNARGLWVSARHARFHVAIEQTSGYVSQFDHWPGVRR